MTVKAWGAHAADQPIVAMDIQRRAPGPRDVQIEIEFCGICHSDLHTARNDWGNSIYPVVPGHEIIGRVTSVGDKVTAFKPGDHVGVGCMVDSCQQCDPCRQGLGDGGVGPTGIREHRVHPCIGQHPGKSACLGRTAQKKDARHV